MSKMEKPLFPRYTEAGMYDITYLTKREETVCADCANKEENRGEISSSFVHWEGPPLHCEECNVVMDAQYGDTELEELI